MKKIHFSLLMLAIVVICTSCKREPLAMVFITNSITVPITLYGEKDTSLVHSANDSICLMPGERTFLCTVEVQDGKFVSVNDHAYSVFNPVVKIGLLDTIYEVPQEYRMFLNDVSNYMHYTSLSSSSSSPVKYEGSYYEYTLHPDFVEEILRASVANK